MPVLCRQPLQTCTIPTSWNALSQLSQPPVLLRRTWRTAVGRVLKFPCLTPWVRGQTIFSRCVSSLNHGTHARSTHGSDSRPDPRSNARALLTVDRSVGLDLVSADPPWKRYLVILPAPRFATLPASA